MDLIFNQIFINRFVAIIFLFATLIVGLWSKRAKTMTEYQEAGRSLSSGILMISLIATLISGKEIEQIVRGFAKGYIALSSSISRGVMAMLLGWFVYPKLIYFEKQSTLSGLMGQLYGTMANRFTTLISVIVSVLMISAQLMFSGELANILRVDGRIIIIAFGMLITLYTCIGGIRSVAYTDLLQFGCVAVGSMIFLILHLAGRGEVGKEINIVRHHSFWTHPHRATIALRTFFWGLCPTLLIMPPIVQRVLFFRKKQTIKNTFLGVSLVYMTFVLLMVFIGVSVAFRNESTGVLSIGEMTRLACQYPLGRGLFVLMLISITMSTMDSFLNSAAIDSVIFLQKTSVLASDKFDRNNQLLTVLIGIISICSALTINIRHGELIGYILMLLSVLFIPFFAGITGLKGSKISFWAKIGTFISIFILCVFVGKRPLIFGVVGKVDTIIGKSPFYHNAIFYWFVAILSSTVIFFLTHYLYFGGFKIVDREKNRLHSYSASSIDWSWLTSPLTWANEKATKYGTEPYWVGVFLYVNFFVPYISTDNSITTGLFIMGMRSIGVVLVTLLLIESIWYKSMLKYFNLLYYFTIFFCVPFTSLMTIWQDPQSGLATSLMVQSIVLLIMLVDWQTFVLFNLLSVGFSMLCQKCWHGYLFPTFSGNGLFLLSANTIYSLAVCLIFARKKQIKYYLEKYNLTLENKETTNQLQVQQEAHRQLANSLDPRSSMISEMNKVIQRQEQGIFDPADLSKLKSAIAHLTMVKEKSLEYLPLKPTKITLKALIQNVGAQLSFTGWAEQVDLRLHLDRVGKSDLLNADIDYIQQLLLKSIKYQCKYYQATQIHCTIAPATLSYSTSAINKESKGYQFLLSTNKTKVTKTTYHMSQGVPILPKNRPYLHTNLHIITSHLGVMEMQEEKNKCLLTYVLPCDIKELKPKIPTFTDEDLNRVTQIDDEADVAFLRLADEKGLKRGPIAQALRICKHYHGFQQRNSGELFYLHPVAVTTLLLEHTTDEEIIIAGLLHDTLEDTAYTAHQMTAEFGAEITQIVKDITNLYDHQSRKIKLAKKEVFVGLLEKENKKALLVKLLDRIHNLRTIEGHDNPAKRRKVAQETLDYFIPIAHKLGKKSIEKEMKERCDGILGEAT